MNLYDFQREDVDALAEHGYVGLLAWEPGAGKTVSAITAGIESGAKVVLVVAPKSTHESAWRKDLALFGIDGRILGNGNKAQKKALEDFTWEVPGWYLVTPQFLIRQDTEVWAGDLLICDEIHQQVTMKSKTQRKMSGYTVADKYPLNRAFPMRIALSGTPIRQDVTNGWGLARFLYPDLAGAGEVADKNAYRWMDSRLTMREVYTSQRDQWGNPKKVKQYTGEIIPGKLFADMPFVSIHKRRERCCEYHPNGFLETEAPQEIVRTVQMTPAQRRNIRDMEAFMTTFMGENPMAVDIPLVQKQRIRQMTLGEGVSVPYLAKDKDGNEVEKFTLEFEEDCKSPALDETLHILDNLPVGEPVLVLLESQRFAEVAVARLNKEGYTAAEYSGKRKADLKAFGTDYQVLVGVISAMGTGVDGIQKVCSTEVWLEQPISLTNKAQVEARTDRLGSRAQTQRYIILDDMGVQEGRVEDLILKKITVDETVRRDVR